MELEGYRKLFVVVSLVLMLIAACPVFSIFVSIPVAREFFSEFWVLGPDHRAEDYPFNVGIDEVQGPVYVAVRNHMGYSVYYLVYVKVRNQTQSSPSRSLPSSLDPVYEFRFLLSDRELWETPFVFSFQGEPSFVSGVSINGDVLPVNCSSMWDSVRDGFYYQLFFELWFYNSTLQDFQFHDRFVGIWLNMTRI